MAQPDPLELTLSSNRINAYYALDEAMVKAHRAENHDYAESTAHILMANPELPLIIRARACMVLGCSLQPDALEMAREGVRIAELAGPGAANQRVLENCKMVLRNAQEAWNEGDDDKDVQAGDEIQWEFKEGDEDVSLLPAPMLAAPMLDVNDQPVDVGDTVMVPGDMYGTVKYAGSIKDKDGTFVGVELDGAFAERGLNDGDVNGISYFRPTIAGAGIFMPTHRVEKRLAPRPATQPHVYHRPDQKILTRQTGPDGKAVYVVVSATEVTQGGAEDQGGAKKRVRRVHSGDADEDAALEEMDETTGEWHERGPLDVGEDAILEEQDA